jgi:hypothetical protein
MSIFGAVLYLTLSTFRLFVYLPSEKAAPCSLSSPVKADFKRHIHTPRAVRFTFFCHFPITPTLQIVSLLR